MVEEGIRVEKVEEMCDIVYEYFLKVFADRREGVPNVVIASPCHMSKI